MPNLVPTTINLPASIAAAFSADLKDELSAGVQASYAVMSFRGKVWRIKYKGEENIIPNAEGDPAASVQVVLVKANKLFSKIYYAKNYEEGDEASPDCFSADGITPDVSIQTPQSRDCASCPRNVWGSKITPQGTKTKECTDSRRVAIVPAADIINESLGGPMLMRIPPASLKDLSVYADQLNRAQAPYYAVATKIGFDVEASFPKLTFEYVRPLTEPEFKQVQELRSGEEVSRILADVSDMTTAPPQGEMEQHKAPPVETVEESEQETAVSPPPKKKAAKKAKPKLEAVETIPPENETTDVANATPSEVDSLVGSLLGGD